MCGDSEDSDDDINRSDGYWYYCCVDSCDSDGSIMIKLIISDITVIKIGVKENDSDSEVIIAIINNLISPKSTQLSSPSTTWHRWTENGTDQKL